MSERGKPCPYHSSLTNGMRLYAPTHSCFTVYDAPTATATEAAAGGEEEA